MKKVLVTGSLGFIASHVIEELHNQGYYVIGLERHFGGRHGATMMRSAGANHEPDDVYIGDIRDRNLVDRAVSASDGVINLAGILGSQETVKNPFPSVETNIFGALNCLEAATIWNVPMVQIAVGNHWEENSYSISKTTAERLSRMYARERGTKVNVVRGLNAYGERQKAYPVRKIIPSFIQRALNGEDIEIYGDGKQRMDMIYVKDVASILIEVLFSPEWGRTYEAGTGKAPTVNTIANLVLKATESSSRLVHLPMRPGEQPHAEVIAREPYPYDYQQFEPAIYPVVQWYKDNRELWDKQSA